MSRVPNPKRPVRPGRRTPGRLLTGCPCPDDPIAVAYEAGRRIGAELERRAWRAQFAALLELAEAAAETSRRREEPVTLTVEEHVAFAEIVFNERVRDLLEGGGDE